MQSSNIARLVATCPDQKGIIAAVSGFFYKHGANITELDQHSTSPENGTLILRLEFEISTLDVSKQLLDRSFEKAIAERYKMKWSISYANEKKSLAIFVSSYDHALVELLWRCSRNEINAEIACVISNHNVLRDVTESFNIPFYHIGITPSTKHQAEQEAMEHLNGIDLIVLARYMQVLSPWFVSKFRNQIINIHHSFLPAFAGADPYRQAYERGVKIIGATAHYVTERLDEGPIIEQDVLRVTHKPDVAEMRRLGQEIERSVLYRAVQWHLEDRVVVCGNRTVVFD